MRFCLLNGAYHGKRIYQRRERLHRFRTVVGKTGAGKTHDQYDHNTFEDNADAHLKRSVMGREVVVAITEGKLDLGTWEQIFYGEFDGMREKRVLVKIIGM